MRPSYRILAIWLGLAPLAVMPLWLPGSAPMVYLLWALLLTLMVGDFLLVRSLPISAVWNPPSAMSVGATSKTELVVNNGSKLPLRVDAVLIAQGPLAPSSVRIDAQPGTGVFEFPLIGLTRGAATLERLLFTTHSPIKFWIRSFDVAVNRSMTVMPNLGRAHAKGVSLIGAETFMGGSTRERFAGEGREFESLSAYVAGMDLRSVDWKTTARHQSLRVRKYRLERRQRVLIAFDVGREMGSRIRSVTPTGTAVSEKLDHAIESGLHLAQVALRAGDLVGLHAYGHEPVGFVPMRSGVAQYAKIKSAASGLASESDESNHVLGLSDALTRLKRRSMVVVFTEFTDSTTAELMIETLGQLARKHVVLFCAMNDPELTAPFARTPRTSQDLAEVIAAERLVDKRDTVLARLARLGVHVVHTAPGSFATKIIERYLQVKKRGLLG